MSQFGFPQFESLYDVYKHRQFVEDVTRQFRLIETQIQGVASSGGGGGVTIHNDLTGRSAADAHPTSAITGLDASISALLSAIGVNTINITANAAALALHLADVTNPHDVTLQQAFDEAIAVPQISVPTSANPFTIDLAAGVGLISQVRDAADALVFGVTDAFVHGSTAVAGELALQGSTDAALGFVRFNSPITSNVNPITHGGAQWQLYDPTFSSGAAAFVFAASRYAPTVTVDTAVFIWFTLQGGGTFTQEAATAFSAFNMFSGNAVVTTVNPLFNPLPPLVYQDGVQVRNDGAGAGVPAVGFHISFQGAGLIRTTTAGDVITRTVYDGLRYTPTYASVVGSTVNGGQMNAVNASQFALGLFQPGGGVETVVGQRGLLFNNYTAFGNTLKVALQSTHVSTGSLSFFLLNSGTAQSDFGGSSLFNCGFVQILSDTATLSLGAAGGDVQVGWNGAALEFDPLIGDDMRISFAVNIHTIVSASVSEDSAINFDYPKGAFGEAGAPGNSKYRFVANAETVTIGGGFAQFLLTQAANDTIDAALSQYFGWTINNPTPVIGTGSITDGGALLVGGNINVGTNRYGVLIISNPSGGTLNYALRVQNGDVRFDGDFEHTGTLIGLYGATPVAQSAAYTRNAVIVEDRTLLASASATTLNNNNVLAALIADLQALGVLG